MLVEKNFVAFFEENKTLGKNIFDFFLDVTDKNQEMALDFDSYCQGGNIIWYDILIFCSQNVNKGQLR